MQITWQLDKKFQALYYIQQAHQIQSGFFQRIRAIILPYRDPDAWYFPDYGFFKNTEFIKRLEKVKYLEMFQVTDQLLIDIVLQKLDCLPNEKDVAKDKQQFTKIFPPINGYLGQLFRNYKKVEEIVIVPTKFGTGASYESQKNQDDSYTIYVTYRLDIGYQTIIKGLLSALIRIEQSFDDQSINQWTDRKSISDFMMFNTKLIDLVPGIKFKGALNFVDDYKGELAAESAKYLASLGYPLPGSFTYKNDTILFNKEPLRGLENKEIEILKLLIDNKSHIVSFEQIGDVYWGKNAADKFSLYSIAKIIEKIRKSFEENDIPLRCLQTVRKRGYLLYD